MTRFALSSPGRGHDDVALVRPWPRRASAARTRRRAATRRPATCGDPHRARLPVDDGHLVVVAEQLAGDGPADGAGTGDDDAHQETSGACGEDPLDGSGVLRRARARAGRRSPAARRRAWAAGPRRSAGGRRRGRRSRPRSSRSGTPTQPGWTSVAHEADLPGLVAVLVGRAHRQHAAQHLVGGPADGRDRRDAEALVDLGPVRVVDPGDDVGDAERLAHHARGEDVRVVAVGDRGERVGVLDAGLAQGVAVEARDRSPSCRRSRRRRRRNASGFWSMTATECPLDSSDSASVAPTRPQPMITKCTGRNATPDAGWCRQRAGRARGARRAPTARRRRPCRGGAVPRVIPRV